MKLITISESKIDFSSEEIIFIINVINLCGDGCHPWIDSKTYKGLTLKYVKQVLKRRKLIKNLIEETSIVRDSILNKLK